MIKPRREPASFSLPRAVRREVLAYGAVVAGAEVRAAGFSYGIFEL